MLPPFYLIVDDPQWLDRLIPEGLKLAQLRIKDRTEAETRALLAAGLDRARRGDCTLVINDHWKLALDLGADWVHLGQEDLDTADLAALKRAGIRLGISTHTPDELDRALHHDPDYIALGPIFEPRGKTVAYPPQGLARITEWKRRISCPLVAIGGIRLEQAAQIHAAGADTICVITDVLSAQSPESRCKQWLFASWSRNINQRTSPM